MNRHLLTGALLLLLASGGCRGLESENRPIHPMWNMDDQPKYQAQEPNDFFENGMAMRPPVPGTVAKGFLREDTRFYTGQNEDGSYVERVPVPVTQALLERGRERFDIFCSVCHGQAGFGQGVIMTGDYGYTPAPSYHRAALRDTADGYFYDVIANGVRNMPGYAAQVPIADRWAIVAYLRALQRSQNAQRENVPPSVLARIEQTGSANMNAARNPAGPAAAGGGAAGGSASGDGGSTGGSSDAGSSDAGSSDAGSGDTSESSDTGTESGATSGSDAEPPAQGGGEPTAAATQDTATQDTAADAGSTAVAGGAGASPDTAAGVTAGDTASTAVAENANVTENTPADDGASDTTEAPGGAGDLASGDEQAGGSIFGSTFFVLLLVVLPIVALTSVLVIAFRKDRDH